MKKVFMVAAGLLAAWSAWGQSSPWSLSQCIDYALDHNLTVRQNEISAAQREVELSTAEARRLPSLSGNASQNFSFGRGLTADNTYANTNTTSTGFSLGSDVPLFQGFQIKNSIAMSKLNLAAATVDLEKARDDIRVAVAQAYVQILYDKELLAVARCQVEIDSLQVVRLEEMARRGRASGAEVAAQQATLAQSRSTAVQAEGTLSMALLDLTQLLELPSPEGFDVVVPLDEVLEPGLLLSPEAIYAEAVEIKPIVEAEQIRLDYAQANIDLAKGAFLPSLSLSGGIGSNYYTSSGIGSAKFSDQMKNNFSQYLGLSLSVPVFTRFSNRNNLRAAQLSYKSQQLQLENVKKSLYKEIQQAYYNAVNAQEKYRSSLSAAASASEAFDLMQARYELGQANSTEFNESKARYLEAESNLARARYEQLYSSRLLDFYRGLPLSF
ncbi:MAG: TolC family protein [Bacteroidales bacterium]|nr:TolC family protein [Bacteroidales bacterium]